VRPLTEVAAEFTASLTASHELHEAFLSAVFCEADELPGFVAVGSPGDGFIPVFSSEAELARARGPVKWFSTTGADLFGLVPDGYQRQAISRGQGVALRTSDQGPCLPGRGTHEGQGSI
jgi:hypothetical protein